MSATTCNQFRPNFWRPTICSYCCRPKFKHKISVQNKLSGGSSSMAATPQGKGGEWSSTKSTDSEYFFIPPRANTISTTSPSSLRKRRQNSEPPIKATDCSTASDCNDGTIGYNHLCGDFITTHTQSRARVGIVKPYAVVDLHDTWAAAIETANAESYLTQQYTANSEISYPTIQRQRSGSCNTFMLHRVSSSTGSQPSSRYLSSRTLPNSIITSSSGHYEKQQRNQSIIPKRKAPPPPILTSRTSYGSIPRPRLLQKTNRASSVPSLLITDEMIDDIESMSIKKELIPPNKPPRTQSTFVIQDEEETATVIIPLATQHEASDYEPLRRPGGRLSQVDDTTTCSLLQQLHDMFNETLTNITSKYFNQLTSSDHIKSIDWSDITVCVDLSNQHQLYYRMEPITLEPLDYDKHTTELDIVNSLAPHLNLGLLRGTLTQAPIDYADFLPDANHFIIRDMPSNKVPLDKLLSKWHKSQSEEEYCHSILLILVQVLQGLKYLFNNGIVHRDVGLESLIAWTHEIGCIVKLRNFSYALYRHGPLSATTFIFAYHELSWLGGVESHLPPEIVDTPSNANTLDYAHTDSFAVGCLIYELITGFCPFDKDPQLVYSNYKSTDLPSFVPDYGTCRLLEYLQKLAHFLMTRDPLKRLGLGDALLLTQSMLWLPHSWLEQSISKETIEEHLTYLKGKLITELAQQDTKTPSLENLLKSDFLATSHSVELLRALSVMNNVYGTCNKQ